MNFYTPTSVGQYSDDVWNWHYRGYTLSIYWYGNFGRPKKYRTASHTQLSVGPFVLLVPRKGWYAWAKKHGWAE